MGNVEIYTALLLCLVCNAFGGIARWRHGPFRDFPHAHPKESRRMVVKRVEASSPAAPTDFLKTLGLLLAAFTPPPVAWQASPSRLPSLAQRRLRPRPLAQGVMLTNEEGAKTSNLVDLPDFFGPNKIIKDAYAKSKQVQPALKKNVKNEKIRSQKFGSQQIEAYASGISSQMKDQLKTFRRIMGRLPPFQAELATLTFAAQQRNGGLSLDVVVSDYDTVRRSVIRTGKEMTSKIANCDSVFEAKTLSEQGIKELRETFDNQRPKVINFLDSVGKLRRLPVPEDKPILVLVGMPNVGKSSLVVATSTGTPEINAYPFTTIRLKIGHVIGLVDRYQVMDTPGILARPDEERNPMEGLTLIAVEHLPSSVVFVMDLSGTSGKLSAPLLQLRTRDEVRSRYPDRNWLDVRTKADLPLAEEVDPSMIPAGTLEVSSTENINIDILKRRMAQLVGGEAEKGA